MNIPDHELRMLNSTRAPRHTPAPWSLDLGHLSIATNDGLRSIASIAIPGKYGRSGPKDVEAAEANAYLLFASPDLLQACLMAYKALNETDPEAEALLRLKANALLREAIRKAMHSFDVPPV